MPPASARATTLNLGLELWAMAALVKMSARTATPNKEQRQRKSETSLESNISPPFPFHESYVQTCWVGFQAAGPIRAHCTSKIVIKHYNVSGACLAIQVFTRILSRTVT